MENKIKNLINKAVKNIIDNTSRPSVIRKILKKHDKKIHFIPKKYRIFGGMLQSMNIQFGNFIEELMTLIISEDERYEIVEKYSGKKSNNFALSARNEMLIDNYITRCQTENVDLEISFLELLSKVIQDDGKETKTFKHDIDLLFRSKETGEYYYLEIKYNDDHDTGKFTDINRKFIKTAAYLINELNIETLDQFRPILFYFNNKKMKGNIYIPEQQNIYRGKRFFEEFLNIEYEDVENYMSTLSENEETINTFKELFDNIMND